MTEHRTIVQDYKGKHVLISMSDLIFFDFLGAKITWVDAFSQFFYI